MDKYESANSANLKESSKNEMTLKKYLKRNKILRFGEKMQNVSFWKRQQLQYAADHQGQIEIPNYEIYSNKEHSKQTNDHNQKA